MMYEGSCIPMEQCGCYVPKNNVLLTVSSDVLRNILWMLYGRNHILKSNINRHNQRLLHIVRK